MALGNRIISELVASALATRERAYAPYSNFHVGAALLVSGHEEIIGGCNVENSSYGASVCAERSALFAAVAQGHRSFEAICVAGPTTDIITPCGICRQVLAEFNPEITIVLCNDSDDVQIFNLKELLPHAFALRR